MSAGLKSQPCRLTCLSQQGIPSVLARPGNQAARLALPTLPDFTHCLPDFAYSLSELHSNPA